MVLRKRYFLLLELAAGTGVVGLLLFLFQYPKLFDSAEYFDKVILIWWFSTVGSLLGFIVGLFMMLRNLVHKLWKPALGWLLVCGLGLGTSLILWLATSIVMLGSMGDPDPAEAIRMEAQ
ncbi:apolipoprotein N-acyltransferase [Hymenobacter sp. UYAg731]